MEDITIIAPPTICIVVKVSPNQYMANMAPKAGSVPINSEALDGVVLRTP